MNGCDNGLVFLKLEREITQNTFFIIHDVPIRLPKKILLTQTIVVNRAPP
jgi:hypothetical protein